MSLYREALWALPRLQQPSHDAGRRRSEPPKEEEEEEEEQDEPESKSEEPSEEVKRLRATLNANTAIAWIKLERWEDAASACNDGTLAILCPKTHCLFMSLVLSSTRPA